MLSDVHCEERLRMAFNISKGIVGQGILSLPAGIAAGTGIVPALVVMTAFCVAPWLQTSENDRS